MSDDELPAVPDHVELDEVDTGGDRRPERGERVFGRERRCTAVADPERTGTSPTERDHGTGLVGR
jgi:hypothetical protein